VTETLSTPTPDPRSKTCLACGADQAAGHLPDCVAVTPGATALLIEHLDPDITRTWTVSGVKHNLTPQRRRAFANQLPRLQWARPIDKPQLPMSTGLLLNEIMPQMPFAPFIAEIGYGGATVETADCGCTDVWRCRCDFDGHPFRVHRDPDFWPLLSVAAVKIRWRDMWSTMWLLDIGTGAVVVAIDETPAPAVPHPVSRRCFVGWCDVCPGNTASPTRSTACVCECHRPAEAPEPALTGDELPTAEGVNALEPEPGADTHMFDDHSNDLGDWCPWSGVCVDPATYRHADGRCPQGCRTSHIVEQENIR
jgi:hypothetical protein